MSRNIALLSETSDAFEALIKYEEEKTKWLVILRIKPDGNPTSCAKGQFYALAN